MAEAARRAVLVFAFAALAITTSAEAQTQQPSSDPGSVYRSGYSPRWIDDAEFVYGPSLVDFDLDGYLAKAAPHLVRYSTFIAHWCGYYSISPKVLLTLLEVQSSAITNGGAGTALTNPLAGLVAGSTFEEQVQNLLAGLYRDFYAFRGAVKPAGDPAALNAATFALLNLFRAGTAPAAFETSVEPARNRFLERYKVLFPPGAKVAPAEGDPSIAEVPPASLLQLPWTIGQSWFFNGVHTNTGSDPGVMSSMDFVRTWTLNWGDDTSTDFVVAAHGGTVTRHSSCSVRVTSPTGWATTYYHLDNVVVATGEQVTANQVLATYANNQAQALCNQGSSTGPHVHFSLLKDGVYSTLDGVTIGNFLVHPGRHSYDYDSAFMWLERNSVKYFAYAQAIQSTTPLGDPSNLTINDVSLTEGNSGTQNAVFTVTLSPAANSTVTVNYATADVTAWSSSRSNAAPITIPTLGSASPYPSSVIVQSGVGVVTKVTAVLRQFSHEFPRDVDVLLAGPGGQTVVLMSDVGDNIEASNLTFSFDDSAPSSLDSGALASGTFKPTEIDDGDGIDTFPAPAPAGPYGTTLSVFNGTNPAGTWRLFVNDDFADDEGSLAGGWTLNIATTVAADYVPASGSVSFPIGSTTQTLSITINGDTTIEPGETYQVNLSNPTDALISDGQGIGTILNDDAPVPFTDVPLTAGVTLIKAVHLTELRSRINAVRSARGLGAFVWADATVTAGSMGIKASHVMELRTALSEAYVEAGLTPPTYTDASLSGLLVKAVHIEQIRTAVVAIE